MLIFAHRGASADAPENTLAAFLLAAGSPLITDKPGYARLVRHQHPPVRTARYPLRLREGGSVAWRGTRRGKHNVSVRMQQQQRETKKRRRRRSWGESLAIGLLLIWGAFGVLASRPSLSYSDLEDALFEWIWFVHSLFCWLTGSAALLRYRVVAYWCLNAATLCVLLLGVWNLLAFPWDGKPPWEFTLNFIYIRFALTCAVIGGLFALLARWLARQEDLAD